MGNVYYDRATGERVVPNDQSTWHRSADWLRPAARTIFEMVAKHSPAGDGAIRTACIDEAIDRGADYATMALIRDSGQSGADALDDVAARRGHVGVPAQPRLPRRLLLQVGRPRRRPRPDPDARPVRHGLGARRC